MDKYIVEAGSDSKAKVPQHLEAVDKADLDNKVAELQRTLGPTHKVKIDETNKKVSVLDFMVD